MPIHPGARDPNAARSEERVPAQYPLWKCSMHRRSTQRENLRLNRFEQTRSRQQSSTLWRPTIDKIPFTNSAARWTLRRTSLGNSNGDIASSKLPADISGSGGQVQSEI